MKKILKQVPLFKKTNFKPLPTCFHKFNSLQTLKSFPKLTSLNLSSNIPFTPIKARHFSSHSSTPPLELLSDFISHFKSKDGSLGRNFYVDDLDHAKSLILQTLQQNPEEIKNPIIIEAIFCSLFTQSLKHLYSNLSSPKTQSELEIIYKNATNELTQVPLFNLIFSTLYNDPSLTNDWITHTSQTSYKIVAESLIHSAFKYICTIDPRNHHYLPLIKSSNISQYLLPVSSHLKKEFPLNLHSLPILDSIFNMLSFSLYYALYFPQEENTGEAFDLFSAALPHLNDKDTFTDDSFFGLPPSN